jgi:pimeloyl-ACP methyl ester carboxylesterase
MAAAGEARSVTTLSAAGLWSQPLAPKRSRAHRTARRLRRLLPLLLRSAGVRRRVLAGVLADSSELTPEQALSLVGAYASAPAFVETNNAMRAGHFTAWDRIQVPVTLAWGELDRLVGPGRHAPETVRKLALPGCGHLPMWDDPELVARVILETSSRRAPG